MSNYKTCKNVIKSLGERKKKSIFIFLTNNGGLAIKDRLLEMYENGAAREDLRMMDFHDHIAFSLFNEEGLRHWIILMHSVMEREMFSLDI
ncbi:hypothetical protein J437_LFUL018306 [Ladona fulva]|uniref:Uncharacterized protein n=1 Tax=Ladona fulva TaxID=123851 RepID=A0A8K0KQQ2_LADFU|nr:hypothetical protein J437_LFUL018306 [Ladona fulva]